MQEPMKCRPGLWAGTALLAWSTAAADVTAEPLLRNASLPEAYPDHWLVVHDSAFFHMREGRFLIVDPSADSIGGQLRGMLPADFIALHKQSPSRREHYIIETFFSRGGRGGERTDTVTIYDNANLKVQGEVIIPPKRLSSMPQPFGAALLDEAGLLVVYNFTPSQSISVVDLKKREFVAEHKIDGCALVIPTGASAVTSICGDSAFLTTTLSDGGATASTERSAPIPNALQDPIFEKAGIIDGVAYFPTFNGNMLPVDLSGAAAAPGQRWSLVTDAERAASWRPGGWRVVVADRRGRLYVLMHRQGYEGSHKDGGDQVWVFDAKTQERVSTIELKGWGISLGLSNAPRQQLLVTNGNLDLELYDTDSGELAKTLLVDMETPFIADGVR